jgi:hypothetical protein
MPQPDALINSVVDFVNQAIRSGQKDQLRFAARQALNGFDQTGDSLFLAMYLDCQFHFDFHKGYQAFESLQQKFGITPNASSIGNIEFYNVFLMHAIPNRYKPKEVDLTSEIADIAKIFAKHWQKVPRKQFFLLALFELGEFELVERLAAEAMDTQAFFATLFLAQVTIQKQEYVDAYNYFCDLAAMCTDDGAPPEITNVKELLDLFDLIYSQIGMRPIRTAEQLGVTKDSKPLSSHIASAAAELFALIKSQLPDEDETSEMPLDQLLQIWPSHATYLGPEGDDPIGGIEVSYNPDDDTLIAHAH